MGGRRIELVNHIQQLRISDMRPVEVLAVGDAVRCARMDGARGEIREIDADGRLAWVAWRDLPDGWWYLKDLRRIDG